MRRFGEIYKQKLNESEERQENKILEDFKVVYAAMLEQYGLTSVHQLDEESQTSFLTELNHYWSEEEGVSEKGYQFLQKRSMALNENSTAVQKKNFLREKSFAIINESFRQTELKWRLYDVIDEMYKQLKANDVADILTPEMITGIISESLQKSTEKLLNNIYKELSESAKPKRKYSVQIKTKK
jgi:hypothetical protein